MKNGDTFSPMFLFCRMQMPGFILQYKPLSDQAKLLFAIMLHDVTKEGVVMVSYEKHEATFSWTRDKIVDALLELIDKQLIVEINTEDPVNPSFIFLKHEIYP